MGSIAGELYASLLLGAIGTGLFFYAKRQRRAPHLVAGIALMAVPYFIRGTAWILVFGAVTGAVTFAVARLWP